ncbi:unnamed protein product [Parnassius apollo]|uniref:(apollo) hypothetical protein n=1 Tax=Parnassius apollo TaxID=110799 RepID=A0A8S3WLE0_PARAO|nr:unnamed protein product [Parnassius apollo]
MPPTETALDGMLCLSRHENCPWDEALKSADITWTGLRYTCLKILHLYCKVFDQEDILELVLRKTCKSCGCDRLQHSVYHEELGSVRDRLGLRDTRVNHHAYDSPPGLTAKQTELFWASLAERAPTSVGGATGAAAWRAWRTRALATQLPKQDLSLSHCQHIDESHRKQFEDFVSARNEIALDIGIACQHHGASIECMGCSKPIRNGSIIVQAPRIGEEVAFHPACFTCSECDELLVELAYCALDGRLYCVRHYSERLKPRCHACDEVRLVYLLQLTYVFVFSV